MNRRMVSCLCVTEGRAAFMDWLLWGYDRQTHADRELVVVDSSAKPWVCDRPDVRVVSVAPGLNVPAKRNCALEEARGTFVAWFDDDDWQHPERLARLVHILERNDAAYCGTSRSFFLDLYARRARSYDGMGSLIFNGAVFRREALAGLKFDEQRRKASDTPWLREVRRRLGPPRMDDRLVSTIWLSHDHNISNPRQRRRFGLPLQDVRCVVGDEAWGDTEARMAGLADAVPTSLDTAQLAGGRSMAGTAIRQTVLRRRRGDQWTRHASSSEPEQAEERPARPPVVHGPSTEEKKKAAGASRPEVTADLLLVGATGPEESFQAWRSSFQAASGVGIEHAVVAARSSDEARCALAEGKSSLVVVGAGWTFLRVKSRFARLTAQLLTQPDIAWCGIVPADARGGLLASRACLGVSSRRHSRHEIYERVTAPTPLWLARREAVMRWLSVCPDDVVRDFEALWKSILGESGVWHLGPRQVSCFASPRSLSAADIHAVADAARAGVLRSGPASDLRSAELLGRLRRRAEQSVTAVRPMTARRSATAAE